MTPSKVSSASLNSPTLASNGALVTAVASAILVSDLAYSSSAFPHLVQASCVSPRRYTLHIDFAFIALLARFYRFGGPESPHPPSKRSWGITEATRGLPASR